MTYWYKDTDYPSNTAWIVNRETWLVSGPYPKEFLFKHLGITEEQIEKVYR